MIFISLLSDVIFWKVEEVSGHCGGENRLVSLVLTATSKHSLVFAAYLICYVLCVMLVCP